MVLQERVHCGLWPTSTIKMGTKQYTQKCGLERKGDMWYVANFKKKLERNSTRKNVAMQQGS